MKKSTKKWLIAACILFVMGCVICLGTLLLVEDDFVKMFSDDYEVNKHEITEQFNNISVITDVADIEFVKSEEEKITVVCHERNKLKHQVSVQDDTLVVKLVDTRKWHDYFGISFVKEKIIINIPNKEYGNLVVRTDTGNVDIPAGMEFQNIDVKLSTGKVKNEAAAKDKIKIQSSTGDIFINNIMADELDISASTGDINVYNSEATSDLKVNVTTGNVRLEGIKCKNLHSEGDTGSVFLGDVLTKEKISISRSTGDVVFQDSDGGEIFVVTDTGDVRGNILTDKVFLIETDTGNVDVPKSVLGGKCEIKTDTGNVQITID